MPPPVEDALSDDLNTPLAISAVHQLSDPAQLRAGANALGLLQQDVEAWFRWTPAGVSGPDEAEIEAAIAARQAARKAKNFAEADRIRDDLAARGVVLQRTVRKARCGSAAESQYLPPLCGGRCPKGGWGFRRLS